MVTQTNKKLHHALTLGSRVSVSSGLEAPVGGPTIFRKGGPGACGAIFGQDGDEMSVVIKLAKSSDHTELWNGYQMHAAIAHEFGRRNITGVRVPECYFFVPSDRTLFWDKRPELLDAAKDVCHLPTAGLYT